MGQVLCGHPDGSLPGTLGSFQASAVGGDLKVGLDGTTPVAAALKHAGTLHDAVYTTAAAASSSSTTHALGQLGVHLTDLQNARLGGREGGGQVLDV